MSSNDLGQPAGTLPVAPELLEARVPPGLVTNIAFYGRRGGAIIATGGALGSLLGQLLHTTAAERKTLLAVELLLFELRPRSLIPVALASAAATGVRIAFAGTATSFVMPNIVQPSESALAAYVVLGALVGIVAVGVTKLVYAIEDGFEHLPIHWMWWPAIGAVAVGICGYFVPRTLGVGYDNIDRILSADIGGEALLLLAVVKFISWSISRCCRSSAVARWRFSSPAS
jgi:H+/Cl- antiporter ClcA